MSSVCFYVTIHQAQPTYALPSPQHLFATIPKIEDISRILKRSLIGMYEIHFLFGHICLIIVDRILFQIKIKQQTPRKHK